MKPSEFLTAMRDALPNVQSWAKEYFAYSVPYFQDNGRLTYANKSSIIGNNPHAVCRCVLGAAEKVMDKPFTHEEKFPGIEYLQHAISRYCKSTGIDLGDTEAILDKWKNWPAKFNDHPKVEWADIISVLEMSICMAQENNE